VSGIAARNVPNDDHELKPGYLAALDRAAESVPEIDVSDADEAALRVVLARVRVLQRCLDGLVLRIGARSESLAESGQAPPAAELLRADGSTGAATARREARRVQVVDQLPGAAAAVDRGELSGEHVDAMARHVLRLTPEQRARLDVPAVLAEAQRLSPERFGRFLKRMVDRIKADHGLDDTVARQMASEFRHWFDDDTGMGRFSGALDPERYEMLISAVEQRCSTLAAAGGTQRNANLAADALVQLVNGASSGRPGTRSPSIVVVVDQKTALNGPHSETICETEHGRDIALESLGRLACDATIRRVLLDDRGVPINVGRKHRVASDAQWAALKAVYSTCAWHGCTAPVSWCQAHHIRPWEANGKTDLDNLVPLCSRHHHRVHEGRWSIALGPDRALTVYKPDGSHYVTLPRPGRSPKSARAA
jgi:hypothetical protein